jgi:hypothetical protein
MPASEIQFGYALFGELSEEASKVSFSKLVFSKKMAVLFCIAGSLLKFSVSKDFYLLSISILTGFRSLLPLCPTGPLPLA